MADWERPLSALVDPPLASPPPLGDIEDRARRHRYRRRVGTGAGAGLSVVALVAAVIAWNPAGEQTVQTAATGGAAMTRTAQPFPESATVLEFDANGARWKVVAVRQVSGGVCLGLLPDGENAAAPQCWTPDDRPVQAAAAANADLSYVFGIAAKSVTDVSVTAPAAAKAQLFGQAAGFPVNFFGYVVPSGVNHIDLQASLGNGQPFLLGVTVHGRISVVNGQDSPALGAPTTTVVRNQEPGSIPPVTPVTTVAPPATMTPPATSPPTTVPPLLGIPKLITITTGASNLNKIRFESAVASGSQGLAVRFWAGVEPCTVLGKVDVVESADKVTVTLWTGTTNSLILCTALAQYFETIVPLSAPLGARVVIDGAA